MSGNQEILTESDKEKMKTFLSTIYKQIPVFSGNPDELDHFLDCIQRVESPSLTKTLFAMIRSKLQGPASEAVKDQQMENLEELREFLVSKFKSPSKVCKSPLDSSAKENGVGKGSNVQQNGTHSTPPGKSSQKSPKKSPVKAKTEKTEEEENPPKDEAEKSTEKIAEIKTEKNVKEESKDVKANSKKSVRNVPKSERKEELKNLLKNKKFMRLIDEYKRKNMTDNSTQTDDTSPETTDAQTQVEVPSETMQEVPIKVTKDQKSQTVRRSTKLIKNFVTVNIYHSGDSSVSSENIKKEIIENLDASLLNGIKEGGTGKKDPKRNQTENEGETSNRKNEDNVKPPEPDERTKESPDLEMKPLETETSTDGIQQILTKTDVEDPKMETETNPNESTTKIPDKSETKPVEKPTYNKTKNSNERPNNITLTGKRRRCEEDESLKSDKKSRNEDKNRSPSKSKRFSDKPRKADLYCSYCQRRGHLREECRIWNRIKNTPFCDFCKVKGHSEAQCRKRAMINLAQPINTNFVNTDNVIPNNWNFSLESFIASCYDQARNDTFNFGQSNSSNR